MRVRVKNVTEVQKAKKRIIYRKEKENEKKKVRGKKYREENLPERRERRIYLKEERGELT